MPDGIRIVPRADSGLSGVETVCIVDHSRPRKFDDGVRPEQIVEPCRFCGQRHLAKHYPIHLHRGSAIVSPEVWARLRALADNPFEYSNPVPDPPAQGITIVGAGVRSTAVRLRNTHPDAARWPNPATLCVEDPNRPRKAPPGFVLDDLLELCRACGQKHRFKVYPLVIEDGYTLVSPEVWERLQKIPGQPFVFDDMAAPRPQFIAPQMTGRPELIERFVMPLTPPTPTPTGA